MNPQSPSEVELYRSPKRVRVLLGGLIIADSRRATLLRREDRPPVYYFPPHDVRQECLKRNGKTAQLTDYGEATCFTVSANGIERPGGACSLDAPVPGLEDLAGYITFDWNAMDAWFEEDEEIFVHPRDPRKRIDISPSSAHVRVHLNGETIAESHRPTLLFETGLATRYYLPRLDLRQELLVPSDHITYCPYKGEANYYSLRLGDTLLEDLIWYYRYPTLEAAHIAGLCCFYQERIGIEVDGELLK